MTLTAPALSCKTESVKTYRAASGLRRDAERSVFVLGLCAPECLHVVRHGGVLWDLNSTRAFILPENVKNHRRCHMAQTIEASEYPLTDIYDRLYPVKCMISFMGYALMAIAEESQPMNDDEAYGSYSIFRHIEDEIAAVLEMADALSKNQQRKEA